MVEALPLTAQRILETLNAHSHALHALGVRKIGLFGSYRRGESSQASDIDLLVTLARDWDIVQNQIPDLRRSLTTILNDLDEPPA